MRRTSRRSTSRRFRPNALREHTLYTIHTVYETPSGETKTSRDTWLAKFGKPTNANLAKIASRFSEGRVISAEIVKLNGDVLASWSAMRRNSRRLRRNTTSRIVPVEKAKKGDMVEVELGVPWPADSRKEKFTGRIVQVKRGGVVTIDVGRSRSNPDGHPNEDVDYIDYRVFTGRR